MSHHSKYQQKVIQNYYNNREALALQRVQELITELYLSTGKKRERHWQSLASNLEKLGVPATQIEQIVSGDNPERAADLVRRLMAKS